MTRPSSVNLKPNNTAPQRSSGGGDSGGLFGSWDYMNFALIAILLLRLGRKKV